MENKKIKFYQEYFNVDYENPVYYMILIECEYDIPVNTYVIRIPTLDLRFKINPYILN